MPFVSCTERFAIVVRDSVLAASSSHVCLFVELHQNQSSLLVLLLIALFPAHLDCRRGSQLRTRSAQGGSGRRMPARALPQVSSSRPPAKKPQMKRAPLLLAGCSLLFFPFECLIIPSTRNWGVQTRHRPKPGAKPSPRTAEDLPLAFRGHVQTGNGGLCTELWQLTEWLND